MTEQEELQLRMITPMSAFTLYIDDITKLKTIKKLKRLGIDEKKGSLATTIRVLLKLFACDVKDNPTDEEIAELIHKEYLFTTKKNKRSSL